MSLEAQNVAGFDISSANDIVEMLINKLLLQLYIVLQTKAFKILN